MAIWRSTITGPSGASAEWRSAATTGCSFGSDLGGNTAAVLRSFVASCQRVGVDPYAWFKDVLTRIADHPITRLAELLPHNWKPAQA